jgi:hypothetical protein
MSKVWHPNLQEQVIYDRDQLGRPKVMDKKSFPLFILVVTSFNQLV